MMFGEPLGIKIQCIAYTLAQKSAGILQYITKISKSTMVKQELKLFHQNDVTTKLLREELSNMICEALSQNELVHKLLPTSEMPMRPKALMRDQYSLKEEMVINSHISLGDFYSIDARAEVQQTGVRVGERVLVAEQ